MVRMDDGPIWRGPPGRVDEERECRMDAKSLEEVVEQALQFTSKEYRIERKVMFRWREGPARPVTGLLGSLVVFFFRTEHSYVDKKTGETKTISNIFFDRIPYPTYSEGVAAKLEVPVEMVRALLKGFDGEVELLSEEEKVVWELGKRMGFKYVEV